MLRVTAFALILLSVVVSAQDKSKAQPDRGKVLDAAAKTPFFTQKGADAVKRVIAGGQVRNVDEKLLDPATKAAAQPNPAQTPQPAPGQPSQPGPVQPGQQAPTPPPAGKPFTWRLIGISYGKRQGMALFLLDGKSKSVCKGESLDEDAKVLSVDRRHVVLMIHGKRVALSPW